MSYAPIDEVRRVTKRYRFHAMRRALVQMGIPFRPAADGEPLVRQEHLDCAKPKARNETPRFHLISR